MESQGLDRQWAWLVMLRMGLGPWVGLLAAGRGFVAPLGQFGRSGRGGGLRKPGGLLRVWMGQWAGSGELMFRF